LIDPKRRLQQESPPKKVRTRPKDQSRSQRRKKGDLLQGKEIPPKSKANHPLQKNRSLK